MVYEVEDENYDVVVKGMDTNRLYAKRYSH